MKHPNITEEALAALVGAFYAKVRRDPLIGPVFNRAIEDWDEHLPKLQSFWSSVMLGTGRYKGRPMPAHVKHGDAISPRRFRTVAGAVARDDRRAARCGTRRCAPGQGRADC